MYDVGNAPGVPNILNIVGYLPGYQNNGPNKLGHYVTGDQYTGWVSGTQSMGWYDESDLNSQGHNISYTVSYLNSLSNTNNTPNLNFQGIVF